MVDATPQELSRVQVGSSRRSLSQCGPAPVKAIKNGEITIGFDTNFIFSEVYRFPYIIFSSCIFSYTHNHICFNTNYYNRLTPIK